MDKKMVITNFVCRNFQLGDKVNSYFKGKFYNGEIIKKERGNYPTQQPRITIKTYEKLGKDTYLLDGYGLRGQIYSRDPTFFEDEPLPEGDEIYKKMHQRPMTKNEIEECNKSFPF